MLIILDVKMESLLTLWKLVWNVSGVMSNVVKAGQKVKTVKMKDEFGCRIITICG